LEFQTGANAGQQTPATLPASNPAQLGISAVNVTVEAGQQSALGQIDQAIDTTSANRASIGATENSLQAQANQDAVNSDNQAAARSQLADTNVAQASTQLASSLLQQQFSIFALQQQAHTFALTSSLLAA
ncbi:MAG: hypothetical protein JOZ39_07860, partial [Chloroflexi bacterium]|nr:hypothetical protein [Chloroflexota bacterium]